jgi:hypothetical protein
MNPIWADVLDLQSLDPSIALTRGEALLQSILSETKNAIESGYKGSVVCTFSKLKMIQTLVAFAISDNPPQFSSVLFPFLEQYMTTQFGPLITKSWIRSVAQLLQYAPRPKRSCLAKFIHQMILFVSAEPSWIPHLLTSPQSSPFFRVSFQMIPLLYQSLAGLFLQMALRAVVDPDFETYIIDHSSYIASVINFIIECLVDHTTERAKHRFMHDLGLSISGGPGRIRLAFDEAFNQDIIVPFVIDMDTKNAIENAIWLMVAFGCAIWLQPLCAHLEGSLPGWVTSGSDDDAVLALQCCSLMVGVAQPFLTEKAPSPVTITADCREIPAAWFSLEERTAGLVKFAMNRAICASCPARGGYFWMLDGLLEACGRLMDTFLQNSLTVNLALTEFYTNAAVLTFPAARFVFLSKDCVSGLRTKVGTVCETCSRRFGSKPTSANEVQKAYQDLARKTTETPDAETLMFRNIVVLIEFLKDLDAIVLAINLLNQRDVTN